MGKVKEIKRTANVAWSPRPLQSIYLAAGTVAQQLDATFSTTANLEIFSLDLTTSDLVMPVVGHVESKQRFHKLIWSDFGRTEEMHPMGLVIGGSDNGSISLWDPDKIIQSENEGALVMMLDQHVGPVRALDINPFQANLLASGASDSEIFIWDLNNPSSAMSPGNKLHPLEDINSIAWNRQVQHILASTSPNGRSVVWDLRKNEPIIQVSDSSSRIRCKAIVWHPDIATQLVTGSEDDRCPVIQLWDLRYATAPMRTLERHNRGVLCLEWCPQDCDLLLSAAKDNHVYCWNPNTDVPGGEVVYQLPATTQWIFECHWCPRNPAIISTSSFDGHISLYSLLGGGASDGRGQVTEDTIDNNDPFANIALQQKVKESESAPLKTPPKWFRRPCGASFGFGGKLVSFSDSKHVVISQVVTEQKLLQQSMEFEEAINQQLYSEYCTNKLASSTSHETIWSFLKATFDPEPRRQYLQLLGFSPEQIAEKITEWVGSQDPPGAKSLDVDKLQDKLAVLPLSEDEDNTQQIEEDKDTDAKDGITTAELFGLEEPSSSSAFDDLSGIPLDTPPLVKDARVSFVTNEDTSDGLLTTALLVGNFKAAVDICISNNQMSEALILAVAGGAELFQSTQQHFFQKNKTTITQLISLITSRNWSEIVQYGNLDNWCEILALLVTYSSSEEFATLCDLLGERLEDDGKDGCYDNAALCYICSGNINKFTECCMRSCDDNVDPLILQDLIEKVVLLRQAVQMGRHEVTPMNNPLLVEKLSKYSSLLISQGSLQTALQYLEQIDKIQTNNGILYDRLYRCLGGSEMGKPPQFPFEQVNVLPPLSPAVVPTVSPTMSYQQHLHDNTEVIAQPIGVRSSYQHTEMGRVYSGYPTGPYSQVTPTMMPTPPLQPTMIPTPPTRLPTPPLQPTMMPIPSTQPHGATNMMVTPTQSLSQSPPTSGMYIPGSNIGTTWNDPPVLRQTKKSSGFVAPPPPLTAPLANQEPLQPLIPPSEAPPTAPPTNVKPGTPTTPQQPPSPMTPAEQQPIPSEHVLLYTIFNGLLTQCKARANSNVMRRKVDDIGRKLDHMYDLLRQSRLSPDILQGLHAIAQDTQAINYPGGLARLNHMVSTSNLSEITSFMPGIKTLLQLGMQLRV